MKSEKNAIAPLCKAYDSLAWMNLTAHLYNLTEGIRDGQFGMEKGGLSKELDGIYGRLITEIRDYLERGDAARESVLSAVSKLRAEVVNRSEQVQVFTDSLQIYE